MTDTSIESLKTPLGVTQGLIPENKASLCRAFLADEEAPAQVVYEAVKALLGKDAFGMEAWEPETVWLMLVNKKAKDIPEVNKNKILCCIALKYRSEIFTNINEFTNVILALNSEIPNVDQEEIVDSEELAWAVVAIEKLLPDRPILLDYEPLQYCARILHDEGFFIAPENLSFCQKYLSKLNNNREMESIITQALKAPIGEYNDIIAAQLTKHRRVTSYIQIMGQNLSAGLQALSGGQDKP